MSISGSSIELMERIDTVHGNSTPTNESVMRIEDEKKEVTSLMGFFKKNVPQLMIIALQNDDVNKFKTLLNENADLNSKFGNDQTTLLNIACAWEGKKEFVELLLEAGANPNEVDNENQTALHHAALMGNEKIMQLLLESSRIRVNVNALTSSGNTALHSAVSPDWDFVRMDSLKSCVKMLMEHGDMEFNRPNYFGNTPLWLAQEQPSPYNRELLEVLLVQGGARIDVNIFHMRSGDTIRERIKNKFPDLIRFLPKDRENMPPLDPLMEMILSPNPHLDDFNKLLNRGNFNVNERFGNPYYCTYLELACRRKDLPKSFLTALIQKGADIKVQNENESLQNLYCSALHQAVSINNLKAVRVLTGSLNHEALNIRNAYGQTALHIAAQKRYTPQEEPEMQQCINLLLGLTNDYTDRDTLPSSSQPWNEQGQRPCVEIDTQDECTGGSALHDAAFYANNSTVLALLDGGADIMLNNWDGVPPLNLIDADTLETFLDKQISANHDKTSSKDFQVCLSYNSLCYQQSNFEMYIIDHISRSSEHCELLQHPIILSFIELKWHLVRWLFYTHLAIFVFFNLCFTFYIFLINSNCNFTEKNYRNNFTSLKLHDSINCTGLPSNMSFTGFSFTFGEESVNGLRITCILLLTILALIELMQCIAYCSRYFKDLENIFEICTFTLCGITLSKGWKDNIFHAHGCGIAILFIWVELVLISGRLALFSLQLAMLNKVTLTFFRFMVWYSLLIIAFALSFYIVFDKTTNVSRNSTAETASRKDFFLYPDSSIFKTLILMAGDLTVSFATFNYIPGTSHLIFLFFIFLIIIILLNLLNGLAVSDTQAIQNDAKILSLASRVKLIFYLENMLVAVGTYCFWGNFFKDRIKPIFRVFDPSHQEKRLIIQPHSRNFYFPFQGGDERFTKLLLDCDVVSNLKKICNEKYKPSELAEVKKLLITIQNKIDELDTVQIATRTRRYSLK